LSKKIDKFYDGARILKTTQKFFNTKKRADKAFFFVATTRLLTVATTKIITKWQIIIKIIIKIFLHIKPHYLHNSIFNI